MGASSYSSRQKMFFILFSIFQEGSKAESHVFALP